MNYRPLEPEIIPRERGRLYLNVRSMPDEWIVRRPWLKDKGIIGKQEFKEAEFRYQEPILLPTIDQSDTGLILLVEQSVSYTNTIYRSVCLLY